MYVRKEEMGALFIDTHTHFKTIDRNRQCEPLASSQLLEKH